MDRKWHGLSPGCWIGKPIAVADGLLANRGYFADTDVTSAEKRRTLPFYTDYLARFGLGPSIAVVVAPSAKVVIGLGISVCKFGAARATRPPCPIHYPMIPTHAATRPSPTP